MSAMETCVTHAKRKLVDHLLLRMPNNLTNFNFNFLKFKKCFIALQITLANVRIPSNT